MSFVLLFLFVDTFSNLFVEFERVKTVVKKYERYKSFGTDAKDVRTVRIVRVVRYSTTRTDVSNKSYVTVHVLVRIRI